MKTTSFKSIAALFGVAVVLNASVLAGPGSPPPQYQARNASKQKNVATTSFQVRKAPAAKAVIQSGPTLTQVSGPHGVHYGYRW